MSNLKSNTLLSKYTPIATMRIILIATVAKNYKGCRSSFALCIFSTACFLPLSFTEECSRHRMFLSLWFVYWAWSWSGDGLAGRGLALDISFIDEVAIDSCLLKP